MTVSLALDAETEGEKAETDYPNLRLMTIRLNTSSEPLRDISEPLLAWTTSSREVGRLGRYWAGRLTYPSLSVT